MPPTSHIVSPPLAAYMRLLALALAICGVQVAEVSRASEGGPKSAQRAWELAQKAVSEARNAVDSARKRLDDYTYEHFQTSAATPKVALPAWQEAAQSSPLARAEREALWRKLGDLEVRQGELRARLTPEHPELMDVRAQINELRERISKLGVVSPEVEIEREARQRADFAAAANAARARLEAMGEKHDADREQYQRLRQQWIDAQVALDVAINAEADASRLIAQQPAATSNESIVATKEHAEPKKLATPPAPRQIPRSNPNDRQTADALPSPDAQPWTLLPLFLAVIVAAWAAHRLARSSTGGHFSSVHDVGATLSLPIVAVISTSTGRRATGSGLSLESLIAIIAQIALVGLLCGVVAYSLQQPLPL